MPDVDPKYHAPWQEELKANFRALGLVARSAPFLFTLTLAITVVEGGLPALVIHQMGTFVGQVSSAVRAGAVSASSMWVWLADVSAMGERYLWMLEYDSDGRPHHRYARRPRRGSWFT